MNSIKSGLRIVVISFCSFWLTSALLLSSCVSNQKMPKLVRINDAYLGYWILTDIPVPRNPEQSKDIDFNQVATVNPGTECIVLGKAEGYGEIYYELACEGLIIVGWLPSNATEILEYWQVTPAYTEWWTPAAP